MLAVAGGTGGCGKTTVTLGVATALARHGRDPLVVDADTDMPDVHVRAGIEPRPTADAIAAGDPVETVSQRWPAVPSVHIIPAGNAATLRNALARLDSWHGPVLVDCPGGASVDATLPLTACDRTLLVTTDTDQSIRNGIKTAAMARELDAPPVGTLVHGQPGPAETRLACEPTHSVRRLETDSPLEHPLFRDACHSISEVICTKMGV